MEKLKLPKPTIPQASSQVMATFRGGRGVVGNTTFGFWAASLAAFGLAALTVVGHDDPIYLLGSVILPYLAYFLYFFGTWRNVAKNPDAGMTADHDYAQVIESRTIAARDLSIMRDEMPVIATSGAYRSDETGAQNGA